MSTILNIGIILSFFLSILLFSKRNKRITDNILSTWLFTIGIHLTSYFLHHQGYWDRYPHLIGITVPFPFLYGPFLYLYVLYSVINKKYLRKIDFLHFSPAIASYVFLIPFYFSYSAEEKTLVDKGIVNAYGLFTNLILIGFIISGITYSILAYRKLLQHKKIVEDNFSYNKRINMNWLRFAILVIAAVFITVTLVSVFRELLAYQFPFNADILFYSIIVAFVVYIGYSGIRQQDIFSNVVIYDEELNKNESEYKKSGLKTSTATSKHSELLKLMDEERPYLNPKLTLTELAKNLSISSNHLSQIINQYEQVNFYDFINKYRVEEFIKRAKGNKNFSFLAHALDSGFNSKSSFNGVFKKFKSVTPSQYISGLQK